MATLVSRLLWPALWLALALGPGAHAQQTGAPAEWRIDGKVIDARSGVPLARCFVEISPTLDRGVTRSLMTGEDGLFTFDGLAPGKYSLSAGKRGYVRQSYEEHDNFSTAIAVGPGLSSGNLTFKVVPEAVISGVVTDDRGEPVRRAQIKLFKDEDRIGIRVTQQRWSAVTDDRGVYELAHIDPGNYYLAVSARPWYAQPMRQEQMNNTQQQEPSSLDVAYATTFYPQTVDADDATPIPIKGGERIQADVTLTAEPSVHVRIPLPNPQSPGSFYLTLSQSAFGQVETVAAPIQTFHDDVVEVQGILPGHYDFTLTHRSTDGSIEDSTRFAAEVTSGTTDLTPTAAESDATVSGRVIAAEGKLPDGGITLQAMHPRRGYSTRLDQKGEFELKVPPGEYEILGGIPQMYLARITAQDGEVKNRVLTVKAGSAPKLELIASKGFGRIDGIVKLTGNKPASGVMVLLAPVDNPFLFRRDQSDSDGTFTLEDVVPGRYRLLAVERGWELEWANREVLNAFLKKSVPVVVHANDKLTQSVEVQTR